MFKNSLHCQVTFFSTLYIYLSCLFTRPICVVPFRFLRPIPSLKCCLIFILNTTRWWTKSKYWMISNVLCRKNPIGLYCFQLTTELCTKVRLRLCLCNACKREILSVLQTYDVISRHLFLYKTRCVWFGILFLNLCYQCSIKMMFSY
jgi:hypothetical protein